MKTQTIGIAAVGVVLLAVSQAGGQWVDFADQTRSRLIMTPLDVSDALEKDIAVADLNHDGWDDVIVVRKEPFSVEGAFADILLVNEHGRLVNRTAELAAGFLLDPTDARDLFIADFDGDTWEDVVIANTFEQQPKFYRNLGAAGDGTWLGLADESFRLPHIVPGDEFNNKT